MKQKIQTLLADMNTGLIDREHATKAALLSLLAAENLVLIGPPGTAKSMVARRVAQHIQTGDHTPVLQDNSNPSKNQPDTGQHDASRYFEYLLTKFSTPEEIFGPLSISELKADRFRRNTAGYLPTAQVAFLDEIFKASSSILNALLTILNERIFHNGNQPQRVPLRSLIAASNELPTGQEELGALYDRFLMRMFVGPVRDDQMHRLFDTPSEAHQATTQLTPRDLQAVDAAAQQVTVPQTVREAIRGIWAAHKEAFKEDRRESLSDRRLVKLLKLLRVSAATNHRTEVDLSDAMLLQHCLWNQPDNMEKVRDIVVSTLKSHSCMVPVAGGDGVYEVGADGKQLVQRLIAAVQNVAVQTNRSPATTSRAVQGHAALQPTRTKTKGFAGRGTAQDPIRIETAEDLVSMDDPDIATAGLHFIQTADIDCASITHWPSFEFKGHYDGNGKTIRNVIKVNKDTPASVFAILEATSCVTHLRLEGCRLAHAVDGSRVQHCHVKDAMLVGITSGKTELVDCQVTGDWLVGGDAKDTQITDCQVTGGGLVAGKATNTQITQCHVSGGGLVGGDVESAEITFCQVTGAGLVDGDAKNSKIARCQVIDGLPLVRGVANNTHISDCAVALKLDGKNYFNRFTLIFSGGLKNIGLLAGQLYFDSLIERCFGIGLADTGTQHYIHLGGIVGHCNSGTIRQCAVGEVSLVTQNRSSWMKRIIASYEGKTKLQNNASIDTNPGTDDANGPDGKIVAAARFNQRFFEGTLGWDFDTVWRWDATNNRPTLRLNAGACAAQPAATASSTPMQDLLTRQVQANIWL